MSVNRLRALLAGGGRAVGGWCATPNPLAAEILAAEGFDYVGIDCQHGLIGDADLPSMLMALGHHHATPVVRVPRNDPAWIGKALDAGAEAVIVPMVNSAADAERAVRACRYPPLGDRSFGPVRAGLFLNQAPPADVNHEVLCLVMIETVEALQRADEICSVPGVDGVYVGPADLALSMGYPPALSDVSPAHDAAVDALRQACAAHSIVAAIHTASGAAAHAALAAGFQMATVSSDIAILRAAARTHLAAARPDDSTDTGRR
jgi:4-hydroxy-2-oxoheptanedioate aldolase